MKLTKESAIKWHRKMWIWIAREIAKYKLVMDIERLKVNFCIEHGVYPISCSCFCCEYVKNSGCTCLYCPIMWGRKYDDWCDNSEYLYITERKDWKNTDWKKQAKLAYKIAMLPERTDVSWKYYTRQRDWIPDNGLKVITAKQE